MNNIESSVKPNYFDRRIADIDNHYHSKFSKLCAHLIKSSGKALNLLEMSKIYIEIAEMKKSFDNGFEMLKHDILSRHFRSASIYSLKCFRARANKLWQLMYLNKDLLLNSPSNQEDVIEEFISLLNSEYDDFLQNRGSMKESLQNALYEMATELTTMSHASKVTTA